MRQAGRRTAAAENAAKPIIHRPEPYDELTDSQKKTWRRIVDAMPADWFPAETLDLLAEYCEQVEISRKCGAAILALPNSVGSMELQRFITQKEKMARLLVSLATKMRITQQSTYDRQKLKKGSSPKTDPW